MADIIGHLRIFGRRDALEPSLMDPAASIHRAVEMMLEQYRLEDIEINAAIPPTAHPVFGHPIRLEQVMVNLLSNAHDAILDRLAADADGAKGSITVALVDDEQAETICVTVNDNGGGIPEDKLDSIFEPFFTTKEVGQGMGLGLSVSQSIISEMGGELAATTSGEGTSFSITLPYAIGDEPSPS